MKKTFEKRVLPGLLLGVLGASGCEPIPDLSVMVSRVPNDTTQLWAILWQGMSRQVLSEPLIYDLTASTAPGLRDFSFGLKVAEHDQFLVLSTAAFKQTSLGFCIRTDGTAVQPAGYQLLTTLPVLMDETLLPEDRKETCYPTLASQNLPLITGLTFQIERLSGSPSATGDIFIKGWNFSPRAKVQLFVNGDDLTPANGAEIIQQQPNQIRVLIRDETKILKIQPSYPVSVSVTNPGDAASTFTTKIVGSM